MKKRAEGMLAAIAAILVLAGVITCKGEEPPEEEEAAGGIMEASWLFKEEGEEDGEGRITTRLNTNDRKYWGMKGTTLWTVWGEEEEFEEREVKMSKTKGNASAGYGLVICHGVREAEGKEEETMLVVMINNAGEYAVGKVIGGRYESVRWWTRSGAIRGWEGAPNEIRVRREGEEYVVAALAEGEEIEVTRFVEEEEPRHTGGRNGYVVVISPQDRFPQEGVDVYFTEKKR
jgi:hypothetical protein